MARQARSKSLKPNPRLDELERKPGEGNVQWCGRAAKAMAAAPRSRWTYIALLGGADTLAFRLRIAQGHLRRDMLPSYWSESILIQTQGPTMESARAIHVPLAQPDGPKFATRDNGVVSRPLSDFDDAGRYPNIALIALPVSEADILARVRDFSANRATLDTLEHVLRWLAFAWGVARTGNPLHENYGLPSACMLETVCAAASFDLTPGLEARASCPEAIWSAARHWYDYFQKAHANMPRGCYFHQHFYPIAEGSPEKNPPGQTERPPKSRRARR